MRTSVRNEGRCRATLRGVARVELLRKLGGTARQHFWQHVIITVALPTARGSRREWARGSICGSWRGRNGGLRWQGCQGYCKTPMRRKQLRSARISRISTTASRLRAWLRSPGVPPATTTAATTTWARLASTSRFRWWFPRNGSACGGLFLHGSRENCYITCFVPCYLPLSRTHVARYASKLGSAV